MPPASAYLSLPAFVQPIPYGPSAGPAAKFPQEVNLCDQWTWHDHDICSKGPEGQLDELTSITRRYLSQKKRQFVFRPNWLCFFVRSQTQNKLKEDRRRRNTSERREKQLIRLSTCRRASSLQRNLLWMRQGHQLLAQSYSRPEHSRFHR
jgi:hypothetical protein